MASLKIKIDEILKDIKKTVEIDRKESHLDCEYPEISKEFIEKTIAAINANLQQTEENAGKEERKELGKIRTKIKNIEKKMLPKLESYQESLDLMGTRNSYSKTDVDATFMRMKDDSLKPGYNVQIYSENQFVTNYAIFQNPGDPTTLKGTNEKFNKKYDKFPSGLVGDSAYGSFENYKYLEDLNINNYLKFNSFHIENTKKYLTDISKQDNLYYNVSGDYFICPIGQKMQRVGEDVSVSSTGYQSQVVIYEAQNCTNCPLRGACYKAEAPRRRIEVNHELRRHKSIARENLNSEQGQIYRKQRSVDVETVFANVKRNMKFTRFTLCGLEKVHTEFGLVATAHNLKKFVKAICGNYPQNLAMVASKSRFFSNFSLFNIFIPIFENIVFYVGLFNTNITNYIANHRFSPHLPKKPKFTY